MEIKTTCPKCLNQTTIERTAYFITVACEHCLEFWEIIDYEGCCREPRLAQVRFIDGGNRSHVREQCQNCGCLTTTSIGGMSPHTKQMLPVANKERRDQYSETRWEIYKGFIDRCKDLLSKKQEQKSTEWWQWYNSYLKSEKWLQKSKRVLERDGYLCQACLTRKATQAHHLSYEFVGHEPLFDLVAVCDPCHVHLHKIRNAKRAC